MFTRNLVLIAIFCVATVISLPQSRNGNITSELQSNSTETELESNQGLLLAGLDYFLGENGHKLLFHGDSPVQYAVNFDYLPLVSSITTILNFISSEKSPGYVLATYDYATFLSRLSPLAQIAEQYTSGPIKTAIILISSIFSGYAIFLVIASGVQYIMTKLVEEDSVIEGRSGSRSLKHLDEKTENVLTAREKLQIEDNQQVINWLSDLVSQPKLHYDDSSY